MLIFSLKLIKNLISKIAKSTEIVIEVVPYQ